MTSETEARLREQDDTEATAAVSDEQEQPLTEPEASTGAGEPTTGDAATGEDEAAGRRGWRVRRRRPADDADAADADAADAAADEPTPDEPAGDEGPSSRRRLSLPLVPFLAVLLALLLAGAAFLWFTRPGASSVSTKDYATALEAARSEVVDLTSFDYVTLDEDIARIKSVTTGDLRNESVSQLDKQRQQLTQQQAVVSTSVVGAGVTKATGSEASAVLVIQATTKTSASPQAQISRFRIEAQLKKVGGKWLLSGVTGR